MREREGGWGEREGGCHELPGEANRTSNRKRGDMRNREYMEAIKEQTQNGKYRYYIIYIKQLHGHPDQ